VLYEALVVTSGSFFSLGEFRNSIA